MLKSLFCFIWGHIYFRDLIQLLDGQKYHVREHSKYCHRCGKRFQNKGVM